MQPPRSPTSIASWYDRVAAAAVRTLARTDTNIPT